MSTTTTVPPADSATTSELYAAVDSGRADRIDQAGLVVSATASLGVVCGLLINWLGWPVGAPMALVLYLACARLAWLSGMGGSR